MKLVTPSIENDALASFSASTLPDRRPSQLLRTKLIDRLSVPIRSDPDAIEAVTQKRNKTATITVGTYKAATPASSDACHA
jgi:hypothetical protein